jgi:hypothetical protein
LSHGTVLSAGENLLEKFLLHFSSIFAKQNPVASQQLNMHQAMMRRHIAFLGRNFTEIDRASNS